MWQARENSQMVSSRSFLMTSIFTLLLAGCAGTPQVVQYQTAEEYADSFLAPESINGVCKYYDLEVPIERCYRRHPSWRHLCPRVVEGIKQLGKLHWLASAS